MVSSFVRRLLRLTIASLCVLIGLENGSAVAQDRRPWQADASVLVLGSSSEQVPFWLQSNRYGTVDSTSANALLRASLQRRFSLAPNWGLTVGGELLGRAANQSSFHAHQLYGRLDYRGLRLQVGRWEESPTGLTHPTLSIGSLGRSRNAPPLPKIVLETSGYVSVPGTGDALAINAYAAHGWFPDDRFVADPYLHEKYLYLRFPSRERSVQLILGVLQHTIWGGTHPARGPLPQDAEAFLRVLGGRAGGDTAPRQEQNGTIGSTEAGYDFGVAVQVGTIDLQASRYFHHTDRPSLLFRNPWDGMWELRAERSSDDHLVHTLVWNHMRVTRHNAKFSEGQERGADSYYNNVLYRGGWVHRGFTIGSPLLLPNRRGPGVGNNIVVAHHLGLAGTLPAALRYRLRLTYSRHYGAQGVCADASCSELVDARSDRTDQYATRLALTRDVGDLSIRTAVAADLGSLYPDRLGVEVGLSWTGSFRALF